MDAAEGLKQIRFKKARYVIFKIEDKTIVVESVGGRNKTWKGLKREIDDIRPSYIAYDYEFQTPDGRTADKMFLIYFKPENTNSIDAVQYSHSIHEFKDNFPGCEFKTLEDMDEIEELLCKEVVDPTRL